MEQVIRKFRRDGVSEIVFKEAKEEELLHDSESSSLKSSLCSSRLRRLVRGESSQVPLEVFEALEDLVYRESSESESSSLLGFGLPLSLGLTLESLER